MTAAILGLAGPVPDWAAALIVGAVPFAVAGVAAVLGRREAAQAGPPLPQEAVEHVAKTYPRVKLHVLCDNYLEAHTPGRAGLAGHQ